MHSDKSYPKKTNPNSESLARAELDRDSLKSLFHVLVGKPDSIVQVFNGPFDLNIQAISALNDEITRKIKTHSIDAVSSNVYISSSDGLIEEFSSMKDFLAHPWSGPSETEDITIKWDFLINIPNYEIPQRHTLTVKVSKSPSPRETLRRLFTDSDAENSDPYDLALAPMYCRADYINPTLGKELINIVREWHKGLKRPMTALPTLLAFRKYRSAISKAIEFSVPIAVGLFSISMFRFLFSSFPKDAAVTAGMLEKTSIWLCVSILLIYFTMVMAHLLANRCESLLQSIGVNNATFSLTNGDYNRNQRTLDKNNQNFKHFLLATAWAILLNIFAAYLAYHFGIGSAG